ncbi:hypothetical protein DTL21_22050 [Bremerella cremea]|uniref:transposase n=1 Tax=Pirellulaceae TaxID=2691357 RepID=UPI000DF23141|nr:hypothetical protein DTL21_22050 [Bremerella cremea]
MEDVRLISSDKCRGLVNAPGAFLPEAACLRCLLHFYRKELIDVLCGKSRDVRQ